MKKSNISGYVLIATKGRQNKMIKEKEINIVPSYSCQNCFKEFRSQEDLKIIPGKTPFCSDICEFRWNYKLVQKTDFTNLQLQIYQKLLNNFEPFSQQKVNYILTKFFHRKWKGQGDKP